MEKGENSFVWFSLQGLTLTVLETQLYPSKCLWGPGPLWGAGMVNQELSEEPPPPLRAACFLLSVACEHTQIHQAHSHSHTGYTITQPLTRDHTSTHIQGPTHTESHTYTRKAICSDPDLQALKCRTYKHTHHS